eukprot:9478120-Pyramimonas_sp.AAC.1
MPSHWYASFWRVEMTSEIVGDMAPDRCVVALCNTRMWKVFSPARQKKVDVHIDLWAAEGAADDESDGRHSSDADHDHDSDEPEHGELEDEIAEASEHSDHSGSVRDSCHDGGGDNGDNDGGVERGDPPDPLLPPPPPVPAASTSSSS